MNILLDRIGKAKNVTLTCYDLIKPLNMVEQKLLMQKLFYCGTRRNSRALLASCLCSRRQYVEIECPIIMATKCAFPHESILEPLFFVIYVNGDCANILADIAYPHAVDTSLIVK
ncbi:hypothetical protein Trydic_g19074 [Trypoxylus dichotomus]